MGWLANAVRQSTVKTLGSQDILRELLNQRRSSTGKVVSTKTAVQVATVFACMRVIGEGIAQVPLKLMRESKDEKTMEEAEDHPLHDILETSPNEWQTSFEYREMLAMHVVLCGNHYSFVNRSNRAGIMELIPFEPGTVTVKRADDHSLTYEVRANNGEMQIFPAKAIWHVRGPSWNSWMGLEAVQLARESIGLSMAIEEQQGRIQKNGVQASGVYSVEGTLKEDQYKTLKRWIDENLGGPENAGKAMLLDRSAKWMNTSMTGVDAQTLETRRYQVEEICRFFRVNPIMVGAESKNTTYASAEQMFLAHVVHTLSPWYVRLEQSIDANLLTKADREAGLYSCFVDEGLLRTSMDVKKDTLLGYANGGLMTPNEARAKLDMNPDKDPASDKLRIPANIVGAVPDQNAQSKPAAPAAAQDTSKHFDDLRDELKALASRPINVDARTTVNQVPAGAVTVNVPEQKAGDIKVDVAAPIVNMAPTTVNVPAPEAAVVTVNVPEQKVPNIKVDVAAPIVNVAPAEVKVNIEADTSDKDTTYKRDPKTNEIMGSTTKSTKRKT
jgi:HK97 family phage portal protein